jgi:hypothetical protein
MSQSHLPAGCEVLNHGQACAWIIILLVFVDGTIEAQDILRIVSVCVCVCGRVQVCGGGVCARVCMRQNSQGVSR